jgi:hypothetical protein
MLLLLPDLSLYRVFEYRMLRKILGTKWEKMVKV